jgi:hypothetical protein
MNSTYWYPDASEMRERWLPVRLPPPETSHVLFAISELSVGLAGIFHVGAICLRFEQHARNVCNPLRRTAATDLAVSDKRTEINDFRVLQGAVLILACPLSA